MSKHGSIQMNKYMDSVLDTTFKIYKDAAPELISKALEIDVKDVENLSFEEFKEKMYNLEVDYKSVDSLDERNIQYRDSKKIGTILEKYAGLNITRQDKLTIHLYEHGVDEKESVEDIKSMRDESGMSKFLSDIDYVAHELAHGLENKITVDNPSLADERIDMMNSGEKIDFDLGETFAVSMERVVLDKLQEEGALEKYGMAEYVNKEDIEDVWTKKREKMRENIVGTTSDGKAYSRLDLHLVPYNIIKERGIDGIIEYMERGNLLRINRDIPQINQNDQITDFLDMIDKQDYKDYLVPENKEYVPENNEEDIRDYINNMSIEIENKETDEISRYTI